MKITELPTASVADMNDFIIVSNSSDGTRKITADNLFNKLEQKTIQIAGRSTIYLKRFGHILSIQVDVEPDTIELTGTGTPYSGAYTPLGTITNFATPIAYVEREVYLPISGKTRNIGTFRVTTNGEIGIKPLGMILMNNSGTHSPAVIGDKIASGSWTIVTMC